MTSTDPQDIAAALAFLAEREVDTGWEYAGTETVLYHEVDLLYKTIMPGWYRFIYETDTRGVPRTLAVSLEEATPYDIHAITDMLAEWLATRPEPCESRFVAMGYAEDDKSPCWCSWSMAFGDTDRMYERKHPEATNRLAAHLAACRVPRGGEMKYKCECSDCDGFGVDNFFWHGWKTGVGLATCRLCKVLCQFTSNGDKAP